MTTKTELSVFSIVRLVVYVLAALVGLAGVVATALGEGQLAQLMTTISAGLLVITGGTAAFNLPKAPDVKDSKTGGLNLNVAEMLPAILAIVEASKNVSASRLVEEVAPSGDAAVEGFATDQEEVVSAQPVELEASASGATDPLAPIRQLMKD